MATLREPTEEPQPEPVAPRGRAPARLAASSALTTSALSVVGATAPDLRVHLGVGTGALTLIFVAQMLGAVVGSWLAGTVRHRLLELSPMAGLAAICVLAAASSPVLGAMAVAMWAAGIFAFVVNASSQAETMRRAGAGRARALSQFHVWGGAGAATFPLAVAAMLAVGLPWEAAFVLLAAGFAGYALVNRRAHVVPPPRAPGTTRPHVGGRGRWAVTLAVLGGGLQITFPLYYASLLVDHFGASAALASAGVSAYAFGILAARAAGTAALHRTGTEVQLRLACGSLLAGYVLLALAPSTPVVFAAGILLGLGTGQLMPLGMARAAREIGDDRYATGVVFVLNSAMQMAVPGLVAVLLRLTDLRTALVCTLPLGFVVTLAVQRSRSPRG
jgi:predicted MFS family arabinose efflux permease